MIPEEIKPEDEYVKQQYEITDYIGSKKRFVLLVGNQRCPHSEVPAYARVIIQYYYLSDGSGGGVVNSSVVPSDPLVTFADRVRETASALLAELAKTEGEADAAAAIKAAHLKAMDIELDTMALRLGWKKL